MSLAQSSKSFQIRSITIVVLFTLAYLGSITSIWQLFAVGSMGVHAYYPVIAILYLLFIKWIFLDAEKLIFRYHDAIIFLVFFIISIYISALYPIFDGNGGTIKQFFKSSSHLTFISLIALFLGLYKIERRTWIIFIKVVLISSLLINPFGIYQIFARAFDLPFAWLEINNVMYTNRGEVNLDDIHQLSLKFANFYRATSIFGEPSHFALYNTFVLIFTIVPFFHGRKSIFSSKFLNIIILVFNIIALFLAFSLTGFVGIVVLLSILFLMNFTKRILIIIPLFIIMGGIIYFVDNKIEENLGTSVIELFEDRVTSLLDLGVVEKENVSGESYYGRLENAEGMIDTWMKSPVFGVGLGLTAYYTESNYIFYSDFSILAVLAETGIIGFLSIILMLFFIIKDLFIANIPKQGDDHKKDIDFSLRAIFFYIAIITTFVNLFTTNNLIHPWLWLPLGAAISYLSSLDREDKMISLQLVKEPLAIKLQKHLGKNLEGRKI